MAERIQKLLARAGYGSRRACEEFIRQGRVAVNGQRATLGDRADPDSDDLTLDGEAVELPERHIYIALHKPQGVVSAVKGQPQDDRPTVRELVDVPGHIFPVGRLDADSEGLILLTSDGDLANRLTHPRYEHEKVYHVLVKGRPGESVLERWRRGLLLDDKRTLPCKVRTLEAESGATWLEVVMREGRKRQIRRVAEALGHPVRRIVRVAIASLALGDLSPGAWRRLSKAEVRALRTEE